MMKHKQLHQWLWRWHFIAGIITAPFVLVLAITGGIYLWKDQVEQPYIEQQRLVEKTDGGKDLSYQAQWQIAKDILPPAVPIRMVLPSDKQATTFVSGRFSHQKSIFIHPQTGEVNGRFAAKDTWMYKVRKLHGELLGGKVGAKIVELVASWMVVLIITGLYVWFPFREQGIAGVFTVRLRAGKRFFWRDIHVVTGFWLSALLLLVLAGGFPWTDVVGYNFKTIQRITKTGYPSSWHGIGLASIEQEEALSLDSMVSIAYSQQLPGTVNIGLPRDATSTFSVSNNTFPLEAQCMLHFDQYTGGLVKAHNWSDVGILMRGRMWVMAFHQGQFGGWNWWLMFILAIALSMMSMAAILSYMARKPSGQWAIPPAPSQWAVGRGILATLLVLAIVFPLFGLSVLLILLLQARRRRPAGIASQ